MDGVYIHIPFCKSRCIYCDFFSTTYLDRREDYVRALIQEAQQRISNEGNIRTIYFGGGTPSMLSVDQLHRILSAVGSSNVEEITLEANPGDLTLEKLQALHQIGFNRISIGIQSFRDEELSFLGRRHNSTQAREAVQYAQQAGFDNISVDLMYALPNQSIEDWKFNIAEALKLHIQHISCYCLTYESMTTLSRLVDERLVTPADEDTENQMYDLLCMMLCKEGFERYEVSNFALPGFRSLHNSGYWNNVPYIGLGAGAHSYDGTKRRWNIADVPAYIEKVADNTMYWEEEILSAEQKEMEQIMLGLRTCEGIPFTDNLLHKAKPYIDSGHLAIKEARLVATQSGLHILNRIIEDLA